MSLFAGVSLDSALLEFEIFGPVSIFSLSYQFSGGETPPCLEACDVNGESGIEVSDPVYLLNYLFIAGPPPPDPFPACDAAPVEDCAEDICN